jgi:hypothetical protein
MLFTPNTSPITSRALAARGELHFTLDATASPATTVCGLSLPPKPMHFLLTLPTLFDPQAQPTGLYNPLNPRPTPVPYLVPPCPTCYAALQSYLAGLPGYAPPGAGQLNVTPLDTGPGFTLT